jgi:hypothetical protein
MRLLNTQTIEICEFSGTIPQYAILSHTWAKEEITLQALLEKAKPEFQGWKKIRQCCKRAAEDGWQYIWIDTCCIDKTSSAELGEAINSMFQWYANAAVCYVFLEDVTSRLGSATMRRQFITSRWFTRGWTLQELLAPSFLIFLDRSWSDIGTRAEWAEAIAEATLIDVAYQTNFDSCSIAMKFSWASRRKTKRVEDQAYCLLGLFGISMPLLYGEGSAAFSRLQLELIKITDDETIFAWFKGKGQPDEFLHVSEDMYYLPVQHLLASSPALFSESKDIAQSKGEGERPAYSMTNKGLSISMRLYKSKEDLGKGDIAGIRPPPYIAFLNCARFSPVGATPRPCVMALRLSDPNSGRYETLGVFLQRDFAAFDYLWEDFGEHLVTISNVSMAQSQDLWHRSDAVELRCSQGLKVFNTANTLRDLQEATRASGDINDALSWRFHNQVTHIISQRHLIIADIQWRSNTSCPETDDPRLYLVIAATERHPVMQLVSVAPERSLDTLADIANSIACERLSFNNWVVEFDYGLVVTAQLRPQARGNFSGSRFLVRIDIKASPNTTGYKCTAIPKPTISRGGAFCLTRRWLPLEERRAIAISLQKRKMPSEYPPAPPLIPPQAWPDIPAPHLDFEEPWFYFDEEKYRSAKGKLKAHTLDEAVNLMSNHIKKELDVVSQYHKIEEHGHEARHQRQLEDKKRQLQEEGKDQEGPEKNYEPSLEEDQEQGRQERVQQEDRHEEEPQRNAKEKQKIEVRPKHRSFIPRKQYQPSRLRHQLFHDRPIGVT